MARVNRKRRPRPGNRDRKRASRRTILKPSPAPKTGLFDLPRELRDVVYDLLRQDLPFALRGKRLPHEPTSNTWEISYVDAPLLAPMLVSCQVHEEYTARVFDRMQVVAYLSIQRDGILTAAPWPSSLPGLVRDNVRCARLVVVIENADSNNLRQGGVEQYVQARLDDAASRLPSLTVLNCMISGNFSRGDVLLRAMLPQQSKVDQVDEAHFPKLKRLLSLRPTAVHIQHCTLGVLIDVFNDDPVFHNKPLPHQAVLPSDEMSRWYLTLSSPLEPSFPASNFQMRLVTAAIGHTDSSYVDPSRSDPSSSTKGRNASSDDDDNDDDDEVNDDTSEISSIGSTPTAEDRMDSAWVDEEVNHRGEYRAVTEYHAHKDAATFWLNSCAIHWIPHDLHGRLGLSTIHQIWVDPHGTELDAYEPSLIDWLLVHEQGVCLREALQARLGHGRGVVSLQRALEFVEGSGTGSSEG